MTLQYCNYGLCYLHPAVMDCYSGNVVLTMFVDIKCILIESVDIRMIHCNLYPVSLILEVTTVLKEAHTVFPCKLK